MKGTFDAQGQVLCPDLPDQWLGGAEHEDQGLLVAQQRLDGLQMQLNLVRQKKKKSHKGTTHRYIGILRKIQGHKQRKFQARSVTVHHTISLHTLYKCHHFDFPHVLINISKTPGVIAAPSCRRLFLFILLSVYVLALLINSQRQHAVFSLKGTCLALICSVGGM